MAGETQPNSHIDFDVLQRAAGRFLFGGNKRTVANWSATDTQDVADALQAGFSMFLAPPVEANDGRNVHRWRFLKPFLSVEVGPDIDATMSGVPVFSSPNSTITLTTSALYTGSSLVGLSVTFDTSGTSYVIESVTSATVVVVAGDASSETSGDGITITNVGDFRLPAEFAGYDGDLVFEEANSSFRQAIPQRNPMQVLTMRQTGTADEGWPQYFATMPIDTFDGSDGQRHKLSLWPKPSQTYTLIGRATIVPDLPTAVNKYAPGGQPYARALMECVLGCCEIQAERAPGSHYQMAILALKAAISHDKIANGAEKLGRNTIGPDLQGVRDSNLVRVGGQLYTG